MSMHNGQTDPNDPHQAQDMFDLGDDGQLDDFDASLLGNDIDLATFSADPNASFQPTLDHPQATQGHLANIPQPSVELSQQQSQNQYASPPQGSEQFDPSDVSMAGVGAGPLPTGFGVQLPSNVGSTLTDFTKRRNWSARVVEEIKDFLHILTPDGRIMYVSPSAKTLTGHDSSFLVGKFMTAFVHPDDNGMYVREFNESIASGNPLRFFFRFRKADNSYRIFESHGHPHFSSDVSNFGGSSHSLGFCRGFFMMARPYPTKNSSLLDSFLEHKIENERLKKRIVDLKREEQEDMHQQYMSPSTASVSVAPRPPSHVSASPSEAAAAAQFQHQHQRHTSSGEAPVPPSPHAYNGMPPPAKPPISNFALTQRNLDEALAASRPDSINDKMMRYEGANHLEGIEMLTGLKYREGERSKGISTGAMSPMLVRGDQGIEIPPGALRNGPNDRHSDSPIGPEGDRKKKMKVTDEYVCTDCGTLDSPEWRRGPNGPKTLCNACGLRWAKQEKKRNNVNGGNGGNGNGSMASKPSPMVPGAGGSGAAPGPVTSASQSQTQYAQQQLPQQNIDTITGGGGRAGGDGDGDGHARANEGATQQSGGISVPAAGSSAGAPQSTMPQGSAAPDAREQFDVGVHGPAPYTGNSQAQGMSRQQSMPDPNRTLGSSMPPGMSNSMSGPPNMSSSMSGANPMAEMMSVGMQGGVSGHGGNDPHQTMSGMNAMGYSGGPVNMDLSSMMGMNGQGGGQQQTGFGDPGGGGGGAGG